MKIELTLVLESTNRAFGTLEALKKEGYNATIMSSDSLRHAVDYYPGEHHFINLRHLEEKQSLESSQIDKHAVAQLGLVEFQAVEDHETAFLDIASTMVLDMHFDFARGVQFGLSDGFHDAVVFLSVQYGNGV